MKVVKISTGGLKCSTWTWENIFKCLMQNSALEDDEGDLKVLALGMLAVGRAESTPWRVTQWKV